MTCYECEGAGPGGLMFSDRTAVGVCRHCGRGLCRAHGVWSQVTRELLCTECAAVAARRRKD